MRIGGVRAWEKLAHLHADPPGHDDVCSSVLDTHAVETQSLGELIDTATRDRAAGFVTTDDHRGDEGDDFVDETRVSEAAERLRAAFDEQADDVELG